MTPYGSWKSPITADLIVAGAVRLGQIELDGDDVYWVEGRPLDGARNVIVRRTADGETSDVTPPPFSVRTRAHEYGGASFAVADGVLFFSNFADQRVYRQEPGSQPLPLTPATDLRYADGVVDPSRGRMVSVREDHTAAGQEAVNTLVSLGLEEGGAGDVLASGNDFYSSPALSRDGARLAWLTWNHPNMPWDGTELWVEFDARNPNYKKPYRAASSLSAASSSSTPRPGPSGTAMWPSTTSRGIFSTGNSSRIETGSMLYSWA